MISAKLVETVFRKYWALVLPVILVPLLAVALTYKPPTYRSSALVWVSAPVTGESTALGHSNPYNTPAQNQAQVINDLLSTQNFRTATARSAGLVAPDAGEREARSAAARMRVYASTQGINLVAIVAESHAASEAQDVVTAVASQYLERATAEFGRDSAVSTEYYSQQLAVASEELSARNIALSSYLASNPKAVDPSNPASLNADYRTLVERVTTQTDLVGQLNQSLQAVQLRQASAPQAQQAAFNVQDSASFPEAPLPQAATRTIGIPIAAVVFGLLIGCSYIYIAFRTDHTIRGVADLERLQAPLLGSVPDLRPGPRWLSRTPLSAVFPFRRKDFARKTAATIVGREISPISPSETA